MLYSWSCLSKIISYGFLLCSTVIGLDLESHSHSREKVQFFETRLRIIFLALAWRDEIEIIIWPFSYFETRTRFHFVTLMFRDEIETSENHFSWSSEKKWSWLSSRIPGIENSRWPLPLRDHEKAHGEGKFVRGVIQKKKFISTKKNVYILDMKTSIEVDNKNLRVLSRDCDETLRSKTSASEMKLLNLSGLSTLKKNDVFFNLIAEFNH